MLDELMSQYVDVDNKDFWDESVSFIANFVIVLFESKYTQYMHRFASIIL